MYNKNGIHALKSPDCVKRYLGQTGNPFERDLKNILYLIKNKTKIQNLHNTFRKVTIL
jgi:hypothetical protein